VAFHATAEQTRATAGRLEPAGHAYQMAGADTALYCFDSDNHLFEVNSTSIEAELAQRA
jgi:hypothetical protein